MKTKILSFLLLVLPLAASAAPEEGTVNKLGFFGTVWQEPLKLQSATGAVEQSVANYKGLLISYERQWIKKSRGFAMGGFLGAGQASGGDGSLPAGLAYAGASIPFSVMAIQPRYVWGVSEMIDVSLAVAGLVRTIEWPEDPLVRITTSRSVNAVLSFDLDLNLSERISFRQSYGFWSLDVGPFWKWGLLFQW